MQPRRHEAGVGAPSGSGRGGQTNLGGPDHFMGSLSRRSVSPRRLDRVVGSPSRVGRIIGGDRRSSSLERRTYDGDMGGNRGGEHLRARSPLLYANVKRGPPRYDDMFFDKDFPPLEVRGSYEFIDHMDMNHDVGSGRSDHDYEHYCGSRAMRDEFRSGRLDGDKHGMIGEKTVFEDGRGREEYRLANDVGPTSKYDEHNGKFASASARMGLRQLRDERVRQDPHLVDKLSAREPFREGEKPMYHSRDDSYSGLMASKSKDFAGSPHFKDFAGTSSGNLRVNFPSSYRSGVCMPAEDYTKSSAKISRPLGYAGYGPKQILDTARGLDVEFKDNLVRYSRDTFSPTRSEHQSYLHRKPVVRENDDYAYPSEDIYDRMDYSRRHVLRPKMVDPVTERLDNTEFSRGNLSNNILWDNQSHEKQRILNYNGLSRSPDAFKHNRQYLDSTSTNFGLGRKISREQEIPYPGMPRDCEIPHMRIDHDYERDVGPESYKERVRNSPDFRYDAELRRLPERRKRLDEELGSYDPPNRVLKKKYRIDEEMCGHTSRSIMPSNWNNSDRRHDQNDRAGELTGVDATRSFLSKRGNNVHGLNRRVKMAYDLDIDEEYTSEDWFSSHDPEEHLQDHSTKSYKYGRKYSKGYSRTDSLNWHDSNHPSDKHVIPKWKNVWIRDKYGNEVDAYAAQVEQCEDWVSSAKSEPPEDSEEFQQMVHKHFLYFTKKLNDHQFVRKRYQEQGRAGSLFCIVCGRSISKEFMDTQRLATHAFMSHKVGLRAQHLALLKAICVLLGWNISVAYDTVTWIPEPLPSAEAWAQKEDLVLWPPVIIIHNSTISCNDSEGRGIITIDTLEHFLRGKGFGGGKIRVGRSANHSIMLVKYLGTFSGLEDAEKLHEYFAENKHGRKEFNQMAYNKGKSCNSGEVEMKEGKMNELVLYGYMGIAEDLDKVDFDTKRKCLIKSKKEIQDLVDAPVKPE